MRALTRDAATEVLRAIRQRAGAGGLTIEDIASRPWASATFSGARHRLTLRLSGANVEARADAFLGDIEAAEFALRGHIVADVVVTAREKLPAGDIRIRLEMLTVEDA